MSQFKTPREVNFNAENLAEEWRRIWEKSFRIYRVSQKNVLTLRMTRKPLFMNIERNKIASNT